MRCTLRLLAQVKPARYLEPGAPTGLTGLGTHPTPRSTLLYLYNSTLEKLKTVPTHSLYRQSVEALTNQRLSIVKAIKPEGLDEWQERAEKMIERNPELFKAQKGVDGAWMQSVERDGQIFVLRKGKEKPDPDERTREWDDEEIDNSPALYEGPKAPGDYSEFLAKLKKANNPAVAYQSQTAAWKVFGEEPQLTAEQIEELETKIGAGLIEEVIQVAEGELRLVDTMIQSKAWEPLEDKPAEGQWEYFDRKAS